MLCLLITRFRVWLQAKTRKFHKSFKASPCLCYMKIKYSALGLDGNITLGIALCYITILAACLVLYLHIALAAMLKHILNNSHSSP